MGFSATALVAAEPGEAHGGAQFPELGLLNSKLSAPLAFTPKKSSFVIPKRTD